MALAEILGKVGLTIKAVGAAHDLVIDVAFGEKELARRETPPMVTWVPGGGAQDAFEVGGEQHTGTSKTALKVCAMRLAGCEAHVWGAATDQSEEDSSATETLLHWVVAALKANLPARDLILLGGRWEDKEKGAEATAYGRAYVLVFQIRLPVMQVAVQGGPTPVTTAQQTNQAVLPSGETATNA